MDDDEDGIRRLRSKRDAESLHVHHRDGNRNAGSRRRNFKFSDCHFDLDGFGYIHRNEHQYTDFHEYRKLDWHVHKQFVRDDHNDWNQDWFGIGHGKCQYNRNKYGHGKFDRNRHVHPDEHVHGFGKLDRHGYGDGVTDRR